MRNYHLFALLVVLTVSSLNQAEKLKANDRRATGLVPYPRIGRSSDLLNYPRRDRASGLMLYPRVGRADFPGANVHLNRYRDVDFDGDSEFSNGRDVDMDSPVDQDYEGFPGRPIGLKYVDRILKDNAWLTPDRVQTAKEYRPVQKNRRDQDTLSQYPRSRRQPVCGERLHAAIRTRERARCHWLRLNRVSTRFQKKERRGSTRFVRAMFLIDGVSTANWFMYFCRTFAAVLYFMRWLIHSVYRSKASARIKTLYSS